MKNFINIFISLFYIGYIKVIPGTFASFFSIILIFPVIKLSIFSTSTLILFFLLIFLLSIFFINYYSKITKTEDSSVIVIDEFLGIYFILIFYNHLIIINDLVTLFLIFIIFRFFDMNKIFPANKIDQKIKNGFGVIMDDIVASLYTVLTLIILNAFV